MTDPAPLKAAHPSDLDEPQEFAGFLVAGCVRDALGVLARDGFPSCGELLANAKNSGAVQTNAVDGLLSASSVRCFANFGREILERAARRAETGRRERTNAEPAVGAHEQARRGLNALGKGIDSSLVGQPMPQEHAGVVVH